MVWVDNRERVENRNPRSIMIQVDDKLVKSQGGEGWPHGLIVGVDQRWLAIGDFCLEFSSPDDDKIMGDTIVERKTLSDLASRANKAHGHGENGARYRALTHSPTQVLST